MREHYKGEFHRYNIKRNLVNLAPISEEQFLKKKTGKLNIDLKKGLIIF